MEESEPERRKGKTIMSNYGLKTYTPEQAKEQWRESMRREIRLRNSHLISSSCSEALSKAWKTNSFSRHLSSEAVLNYFNSNKQHDKISNYDRTFHVKTGYCSKLKRDDRMHTRGLNVHAEIKYDSRIFRYYYEQPIKSGFLRNVTWL